MGFKEIKRKVIHCVLNGLYDHQVRNNIDVKNLFQCGIVDQNMLAMLLHSTRGNQYSVSPHHQAPSIDVHIFKPVFGRVEWYIKCYFVEPDAVFISVHQDGV